MSYSILYRQKWRSYVRRQLCGGERLFAEIKNDTGIMLVYGGIPLNHYISVHKIYLLQEMQRNQECLALLKGIQPKIKNPEVQKALSEVEAEISKGLCVTARV